jgi:hypothetical protein
MSDDVKIQPSKDKSSFTRKSSAGKGDSPRNISRQFWNNWEEIDWGHKKKEKGWLQDSFDAARNNRISDPEWSKGMNSMEKPPNHQIDDSLDL